MAKNWISAQKNEQKFWEDIYVTKKKDLIYSETKDGGWIKFAERILDRHGLNITELQNKIIVDIGSGPGGLIKGLQLLEKREKIKFKKLIAVDPLMNFFEQNIGLIEKNENIDLIKSTGEDLPLNSDMVDYVFCTNVIDHCSDPHKVVSEAKRILKSEGIFLPSLHLVYNIWTPIKNYLKYIDKNHPFHFNKENIFLILKKEFKEIQCTYNSKIIDDQPKFTFLNIFKNKNFLRGFKRFISNYILFTSYFKCKKT